MTHISSLRACRSGRKYRTRTLNLTPSLRAQRGSPCSPEGMDRHGLRPRDDANNTVIASPPYPARYRTRTLNRAFVTASVARQSMQSMTSEGMDRHGLRPRDDANNTVIASPPYPARYRTRTLNRAFVTASV
ncbi:hypothetical protein, partial [Rhodoferax sp.]|uniref:hypothetical protein n=2 Tax=Rhodoferax sp. TaxID=50421 RepID=UPI003BAE4525